MKRGKFTSLGGEIGNDYINKSLCNITIIRQSLEGKRRFAKGCIK